MQFARVAPVSSVTSIFWFACLENKVICRRPTQMIFKTNYRLQFLFKPFSLLHLFSSYIFCWSAATSILEMLFFHDFFQLYNSWGPRLQLFDLKIFQLRKTLKEIHPFLRSSLSWSHLRFSCLMLLNQRLYEAVQILPIRCPLLVAAPNFANPTHMSDGQTLWFRKVSPQLHLSHLHAV